MGNFLRGPGNLFHFTKIKESQRMSTINGMPKNSGNIQELIGKISSSKKSKGSTLEKKIAQAPSEKSLEKVTSNLPKEEAPKATQAKSEKPSVSERAGVIFDKGVEYLKVVRERADQDRKEGVGMLEGGNKLWNDLLKGADGFAVKERNKLFDTFTKETRTLLTESLEGTKAGEFIDDVASTFSFGKSTASTTAKTAVDAKTNAVTTSGAATTMSKIAGGVGAAYSLYQIIDGYGKDGVAATAMNGATVGAYVGSFFGPVGTVVGGVIGGIGGAVVGLFGKRKKKSPEHMMRDQMRDALKQTGFIDKDSTIGLADGSRFAINMERKNKLENTDGTSRHGYQIDFSNPLAGPAVGMLQPLAQLITGGHEKLGPDLTSYLVNAAVSNASNLEEVRENIIAIYSQSKMEPEIIARGVLELAEAGKLPEEHIEPFIGGIAQVYDKEIFSSTFLKRPQDPASNPAPAEEAQTIH